MENVYYCIHTGCQNKFWTTYQTSLEPFLVNYVVSPCITRSNKSFSVHSLILNVTFPRFKRMCCCILKFWEKPEMVIWEFKTFFSPFWWWLLFATNVWGNVLSAKVPQNNEIWIKIASLKNFHWFSLLFLIILGKTPKMDPTGW